MILSEKGVNGTLFVLGEVLFITRPLIYVLFIRRYGIRSWIPWFLSLAVDFIGIGFLSKSGKGGREQQFHLSASEKDEVTFIRYFQITSNSSIFDMNICKSVLVKQFPCLILVH